mgnify:CR=1 FL=1
MIIDVKATRQAPAETDPAQRYLLKSMDKKSRTPLAISLLMAGLVVYLKSFFTGGSQAADGDGPRPAEAGKIDPEPSPQEQALALAMDGGVRNHHLGIEQRAPGQQTVKEPAVPVRPVHHGCNGKDQSLKTIVFLFCFSLLMHSIHYLVHARFVPNPPILTLDLTQCANCNPMYKRGALAWAQLSHVSARMAASASWRECGPCGMVPLS